VALLSDRERRQVWHLTLASLAIAVAVGGIRLSVPEWAPRVNVRWAPDVTEEQRIALEQNFALAMPTFVEGTTWTYDLGDPSPAKVNALVHHPAVEDTHGIDRRAGVVNADAPRGTTRTGSYPLGAWVASETVAWVGLCAAWAVVLSCAWLAFTRHSARRGTSLSTPASIRSSD
jgi:hypothetical protein